MLFRLPYHVFGMLVALWAIIWTFFVFKFKLQRQPLKRAFVAVGMMGFAFCFYYIYFEFFK